MCSAQDWRPSAAYIYTLHLDGPALAWEYLRRNHDYQNDWQQRATSSSAQCWGLRYFEDPRLDARSAEPLWLHDPDARIRLTADHERYSNAFTLWGMQGQRRLVHDGHRLLLTHTIGYQQVRLVIDANIYDGQAVAYVISAGAQRSAQWHAVDHYERLLSLSSSRQPLTVQRPSRAALLHMRSLQAIDGTIAGASHRAIATVLFGSEAVDARWDSDSELRSQVRYLLRRAQTYCTTKYRELLAPLTFTAQGENTFPTDSP